MVSLKFEIQYYQLYILFGYFSLFVYHELRATFLIEKLSYLITLLEYIHSPDLNVGNSKKKPVGQREQAAMNETNAQQILSTANNSNAAFANNFFPTGECDQSTSDHSASWSLLDRPSRSNHKSQASTTRSLSPQRREVSAPSEQSQPQPTPPPAKRQQQYIAKKAIPTSESTSSFKRNKNAANPWLSVVSDALEGSSSVSERRTNSSLAGYDSDSSSLQGAGTSSSSSNSSDEESSNDESDPILSQIKPSKRKPLRPRKNDKNKQKHRRDKHSSRTKYSEQKEQSKNPHRFMEGLEGRDNKYYGNGQPLSASDFAQQQKHHVLEMESAETVTASTTETSKNPLSSLRSWVASPFQRNNNSQTSSVVTKATTFLKRGPLSRKEPSLRVEEEQQQEEEIQVLNSNSLLGDDELAAIAQYNEESRFTVKAMLKLAWRHPREAFIVFTFVLGVVVFFYSRKKSNEDDVTR